MGKGRKRPVILYDSVSRKSAFGNYVYARLAGGGGGAVMGWTLVTTAYIQTYIILE